MKERIKYQYSDNLLETEQLYNSAICLSIGFTVCTILHSKVVLLFENRYLSKLRISQKLFCTIVSRLVIKGHCLQTFLFCKTFRQAQSQHAKRMGNGGWSMKQKREDYNAQQIKMVLSYFLNDACVLVILQVLQAYLPFQSWSNFYFESKRIVVLQQKLF